MALVLQNYAFLQERIAKLKQKQTIKKRRINQYTIPFEFKSSSVSQKIKKTFQICFKIPKPISSVPTFRLNSNIQLPIPFQDENRLGNITVDPYLSNYRPILMDLIGDIYFISFASNENPRMDFDSFKQIVQRSNPTIIESMQQYQDNFVQLMKSFENNQMPKNTIELEQIEKIIECQSFNCYVYRYKNGIRETIQRIFNKKMLQLFSINDEMFQDYYSETKLLPFPILYDSNDKSQENLNKCFNQNSITKSQLINYNGQVIDISYQQYSIFIQKNEELFEYAYYIYSSERPVDDIQIININSNDYFNRKSYCQIKSETKILVNKEKRCRFKTLIKK